MQIKKGQRWTGIDKGALNSQGWPFEFVVESIGEHDIITVKGNPNTRGFGKEGDQYKMEDEFIESCYTLVNSRPQIIKHKILDCLRAINPFKRKQRHTRA